MGRKNKTHLQHCRQSLTDLLHPQCLHSLPSSRSFIEERHMARQSTVVTSASASGMAEVSMIQKRRKSAHIEGVRQPAMMHLAAPNSVPRHETGLVIVITKGRWSPIPSRWLAFRRGGWRGNVLRPLWLQCTWNGCRRSPSITVVEGAGIWRM
jgi:hypothetical protein